MFEISSSWIGPLLIGIFVALRPYILKRLKQNNTLGNILYFLLVMVIVVPLEIYQARLTITSLDDATAEKLVQEVLRAELLKGYENPTDVLWKPYNKEKKLYNVEAKIEKEGKRYRLYLQPECEFFKGCKVGFERVVILPEESADNRAVSAMDEAMFLHRSCADQIALKLLKQKTLPGLFKILFDGLKKIKKSSVEYEISSLFVKQPQTFDTSKKIAYKEKEFSLGSECKADLTLSGKFIIKSLNKDITKPIFSYIFDKVEKESDNVYRLQTPLYYNIYYKEDIGDIKVVATFIDKDKKTHKQKKVTKTKDKR
jgi:hypothetical protein